MSLTLASLLFVGCGDGDQSHQRMEPTFLEVSGSLNEGAEDGASLAFSNAPRTISVSGTTLDKNAEPYPYEGLVEVRVRPGVIESVEGGTPHVDAWGKTHWYVSAVEGEVSTSVSFSSAYGDTRVWLSAAADPDGSDAASSHATGVTEQLSVSLPTIPQMQDVSELEVEDSFTTSPLFGEFVTVRTDDRQVVVTSLATKGFWASDLGHIDDVPAEYGGDYRGLFIYTFNKPEGVAVGDRLQLLGGGVQEYVGATQLSFPLYEPMDGETLPVPKSASLQSAAEPVCDGSDPNNAFLEAFESSLVTIDSGTIPENFREMPPGTDAHPDFADFEQYYQWPLELPGGCSVLVVSNTTVPAFDPIEHAGQTVGPVTGMLSYVRAKGHRWILLTRGAEDLPFFDGSDDDDAETDKALMPAWPQPIRQAAPQPLCEHDHVGDHLRPHKD